MRRLVLALSLVTAACASGPKPAPTAVAAPLRSMSDLIGLSAGELSARLGPPQLQVREGPGLKLQFASTRCVLDAYLYPPASGGAERVSHVDARTPAGASTERQGCIATLLRPPPVPAP